MRRGTAAAAGVCGCDIKYGLFASVYIRVQQDEERTNDVCMCCVWMFFSENYNLIFNKCNHFV